MIIRDGYIYVMGTPGSGGPTKIGISYDPQMRLEQLLREEEYVDLYLAAQWRHVDSRAVELAAHAILADRWITRELFDVDIYTAFDAVSSGMRQVDARTPQPPYVKPIKIIYSEVNLGGKFRLPKAPDITGFYPMGYVRPMPKAPAGKQFQWIISAGVPEKSIYVEKALNAAPELDLCMKDCRKGDVILAWSNEVFAGYDVLPEIKTKGGHVVYAQTQAPEAGKEDE